jgi:hypothetical protein
MSNIARKSRYTGKIKQNIVPIHPVEDQNTTLLPGESFVLKMDEAPDSGSVQRTAPATPASGDQSETSSGDQKVHPVKAKKLSPQVIAWKAHKDKFPLDHIITNIGENKKRGKAHTRFNLYREGMSVAEYAQVFIDKKVGTRALAHADLRWDHVAGFIQVVPPKVNLPAEEVQVQSEEA